MKYYVQRTMVQLIEVEANSSQEAEDTAMLIEHASDWSEKSIDTEIEYAVLDADGKVVVES